MRMTIVANPRAGRGRAFRRLDRYLRCWSRPDCTLEVILTARPGHAGEIARDLLHHPPDILAVCGGDGTIKEVVSALPDPDFPVAVIPGGTANVLARELGLPLDPVRALDVALAGVVRRVDRCVFESRSRDSFLLMAGIGFDAYVAATVSEALKHRIGMAAYYLASAQAMIHYPFHEFRVLMDQSSVKATSCIIANAKTYGGGLVLTPDADMTDGLLDILIVEGRPTLRYLAFLRNAWLGRARPFPWIHHFRSRRVRVEGSSQIPVQADGELAGGLPVEISLVPGQFPLVVPCPNMRERASAPATTRSCSGS